MEDINVINEKFLKVLKLLRSKKKDKNSLAIEMLDGMYKEYSAIDWIEHDVSTDAEGKKRQNQHYVYKESYAFQLIEYYNTMFLEISGSDEMCESPLKYEAEYKTQLDSICSHVENLLAEIEALEKTAPSETLKERLVLKRSQYVEWHSLALEAMEHYKQMKSLHEEFLQKHHE